MPNDTTQFEDVLLRIVQGYALMQGAYTELKLLSEHNHLTERRILPFVDSYQCRWLFDDMPAGLMQIYEGLQEISYIEKGTNSSGQSPEQVFSEGWAEHE